MSCAETADLPLSRVNLAEVNPPLALGVLDGRYRAAASPLVDHLSEAALNRARVHVEVEWLIYLTDNEVLPGAPKFSAAEKEYLRGIVSSFGRAEIDELAEIEAVTRHDVKAVEYLLKRRLDAAPQVLGQDTVLPQVHEIVHIFCTSEDINNLAYALTIRSAIKQVWLPAAQGLVDDLSEMARQYKAVPMLCRTHGQPATPSTFGKELAVLAWRLSRQLRRVEGTEYLGKINGATGTYGAHVVSVPGADWEAVSRGFVEHLGLIWNPLTTQIESHDWQAELYSDVARYNRIAHNLATDVWTYISLGYFHQRLSAQGSTGSSTMPHKVNPIDFENAEGNLGLANALLSHLAQKLPVSRWQRDLTDSTVLRNVGVALGYSLLAYDSAQRGLGKLQVAEAALAADLDANWEVLAEPIQTVMRRYGVEKPYEKLKELTRGRHIGQADLSTFIDGLDIPETARAQLRALTPASYIGRAEALAKKV